MSAAVTGSDHPIVGVVPPPPTVVARGSLGGVVVTTCAMPEIEPFTLDVPESELTDLRRRLADTRWPEKETVDDWSQGIPLSYVQDLCDYWADGYDWRRCEARLNGLGQFRTEIDGLGIHFLHVRSPHDDAVPLVMTHGWPGSVVEFLNVIEPADQPDRARRERRRRVPRGVPVAARLRVQRQADRHRMGNREDRGDVGRVDAAAGLRPLLRAGR